jgi:hypothetical protein
MSSPARFFLIPMPWVLALYFGLSGAAKAWDPRLFQDYVLAFDLAPIWAAGLLSAYLPALELVLAAGCCFRRWRRSALWHITGLLGLFLIALTSVWWRGLDIDCGCFNDWIHYPVEVGIAIDCLLLAAAIGALMGSRAPVSTAPSSDP